MWKLLSQNPNWRQDFEFLNLKNSTSVNFNPNHLKLITDLSFFWDQLELCSPSCGFLIRLGTTLLTQVDIKSIALTWDNQLRDYFLITRKSAKEIDSLSKQLNKLINSPNATSQESQDAIELLNTSLNNEITSLSEKLPGMLEKVAYIKEQAQHSSSWL